MLTTDLDAWRRLAKRPRQLVMILGCGLASSLVVTLAPALVPHATPWMAAVLIPLVLAWSTGTLGTPATALLVLTITVASLLSNAAASWRRTACRPPPLPFLALIGVAALSILSIAAPRPRQRVRDARPPAPLPAARHDPAGSGGALELALAASGCGIVEIDPATGRQAFSDRFFRLLGHRSGEAAPPGLDLDELTHPQDRPASLAARTATLSGHADAQCELRLRCADGSYRWFRLAGRPCAARHTRLATLARSATSRIAWRRSTRCKRTNRCWPP
ncbi:MAG: PAS domain-containing protein [Burkholderiaceae bacterium]